MQNHSIVVAAIALVGSAAGVSGCSSDHREAPADGGSSGRQNDGTSSNPGTQDGATVGALAADAGASDGSSDLDAAQPGQPSGLSPTGGPPGYSTLVTSDSFGSSKTGATVTDVSQFNPSTPYGLGGSGWDRWMRYSGESVGTYASVSMESDHLEIVPTGSSHAGFVVSHFEALPTTSTSYYVEVRAATGRGGFGGGLGWPAIWFYAGNEATASNRGSSEIDVMETYANQAHGSTPDDAGLYDHYFTSASHIGDAGGTTSPEHFTTMTDAIDVTTEYNVYGCELVDIDDIVQWRVYFNGALVQSSQLGVSWRSTAPAIIIGWNPGSSTIEPAVLKLDWVRVWSK
jgi:hypothetical protein